MKTYLQELEKTIKQDIQASTAVVRYFETTTMTKTETIIRLIVQFAPNSIIIKQSAFREFGKSAILLDIENTLKSLANNQNMIRVDRHLHNLLRMHADPTKPEIVGALPPHHSYPEVLRKSWQQFCSNRAKNQKFVLILEFGDKDFAQEFLSYIKPITENLQDGMQIYSIEDPTKLIGVSHFSFQSEPDYYWNHPINLGSDLYYLMHDGSTLIIDYLTLNEISLLLRLWNLADIAVPALEKAISLLPKYSPAEIAFLSRNIESNIRFANRDTYHAEYKLCRELAFHLAKMSKDQEALIYQNRAMNIIEKSDVSEFEKTKSKGLIWSDAAQTAKEKRKPYDAIRALEIQKTLYQQVYKQEMASELSTIAYNLGTCYRGIRDYEEAIRQLSLSINTEQQLGNTNNEIEARLELGRTYIDLEDNMTALTQFRHIEKMLPTNLQGRTLYFRGITLAYIAYIYKRLGDSENARSLAEEAIDIFGELGANQDILNLQAMIED